MEKPAAESTDLGLGTPGGERPSPLMRWYYRLSRRRAMALVQRAIEQRDSGHGRHAIETLRRAAFMGNDQARFHVGMALLAGDVVPRDIEQGLMWLRRAGTAGHVPSMRALGRLYAKGDVAPKDLVMAMNWFERAALGGDAISRTALGLQYLEGRGIPVDDQKALVWLRQAAEQGEPMACGALGACFENGRGVTRDATRAFGWQLRAAQLGNTIAQYNTGRHYLNGIGTPVDQAAAATWFSKAAEAGDADAQFNLGRCCMRGHGVAQDAVQAVRWFAEAAAQGHTLAKIYLAGNLADGTTGPPDRAGALRLLDEAESAGVDVERIRSAVLASGPREAVGVLAGVQEADPTSAPDAPDDATAEPDLESMLDAPTPFRRACCFFAFHLLPEWLFGAHRPESPLTLALIQAQVPAIWSEAMRLDRASGVYVADIDVTPNCREAHSWVVVDMPVHGLPPEPRRILVDLAAFPPRVFLIESFLTRDDRGLLCSIEAERHVVHGLLRDRTVGTALAACSADRYAAPLPPVDGAILIRQMTLYMEANADLERSRSLT